MHRIELLGVINCNRSVLLGSMRLVQSVWIPTEPKKLKEEKKKKKRFESLLQMMGWAQK